MSTSGQPLVPPPPPNDQTRELMQFLREENEANRRAVREDAQASRDLLRFTVWLVTIPIAALILVVGWFGFKTVGDLKDALEKEAETSTKAEISRMQGEIRNRLDQEFQTPRLQQMVKATAAEYTKTSAEPLIKSEVGVQVKLRVAAEQPTIVAAVTRQTQAAVKQMGPTIDSLVRDSVDVKVQKAVEPVTQRLEGLKADADVQRLIIRMNNDDAEAFDQLFALTVAPSTDSDTLKLIGDTVSDVMDQHNNQMRLALHFTTPHNREQALAELSNPIPSMRMAALDMVGSWDVPTLSKLVEIASSDASLNVRCLAAQVFNARTKQTFPCLSKALVTWWGLHQKDFEKSVAPK
jgi:hypothetical protein